jgi:hypothetical protein
VVPNGAIQLVMGIDYENISLKNTPKGSESIARVKKKHLLPIAEVITCEDFPTILNGNAPIQGKLLHSG